MKPGKVIWKCFFFKMLLLLKSLYDSNIRRKAEEDRQRKEEEKNRRELIKQEYLRRKQQEIFEEQGLVKPKTPKPKQKHHRPKTVFREESSIGDNFSKCSSTRKTIPPHQGFSHSV